MERREVGQQFFYSFDLDKVVPPDHLVRQIDTVLARRGGAHGTLIMESAAKWWATSAPSPEKMHEFCNTLPQSSVPAGWRRQVRSSIWRARRSGFGGTAETRTLGLSVQSIGKLEWRRAMVTEGSVWP
jgi:hypothetical protein